ncbi:MAG: hypothetical protein KAU20_05465 [Nanoarchaeota archaeon]|nr:hypothetical protein [Nanoarchaeota archaeon]
MIKVGYGRTFKGGKGQFRACASMGIRALKLKEKISQTLHERVAEKVLANVNMTLRQPPVKTGRLRQSGSVFVGSKLIGTTNNGSGTPVTSRGGGLSHRIYLIYSAFDKTFNYAYYQNYAVRIGNPFHHLWIEAMMAKSRLKSFARKSMNEIINERD